MLNPALQSNLAEFQG